MDYYNYSAGNPLQKRVQELEEDNKKLVSAIDELNYYYQEKVFLLEKTISQHQQKYEQLLEWKQGHIDKSLFEVERYEMQIKKMIEILDNAHTNFQQEKDSLKSEIKEYLETIKELKEENEVLTQFNNLHESKIEEIVRTYSDEIQKLKLELKELKEEERGQVSSSCALREITPSQNTESVQSQSRITIKGGDPAQSKISIGTHVQFVQ